MIQTQQKLIHSKLLKENGWIQTEQITYGKIVSIIKQRQTGE